MWPIDERAGGAEYLRDLTGHGCKISRRGPMITALLNASADALEQTAASTASEATARQAMPLADHTALWPTRSAIFGVSGHLGRLSERVRSGFPNTENKDN